MKKVFGLVGHSLSHSFSKQYFTNKFNTLQLSDYVYELWELKDLKNIREFIHSQGNVVGFNVTIPYKTEIINYLDIITEEVKNINACNCVFVKDNQWIGYNTDWWGFLKMIENKLDKHYTSAMILGTGGASKAVAYALEKLGIQYIFVSRNEHPTSSNVLSYNELVPEIFDQFTLIINTTPVGMYPDVEDIPPIPINFINEKHFVIDLIYNPEETKLLHEAKQRGSKILNGFEMLYLQAEKSWYIWQELNENE
ncbi:MAG: shikimate 5-dehydrogenase [Bacteroidia bacterium]|nr:MAG: shikimate 5-dehydrogenase [Bacteroidia bacterium]